jgi:SAM-dependent methyltransferase
MSPAAAAACLVCGTPSGAPAYRHDGISVTSTARTIAVPTIVYVCASCAHVQTPPLDDIGGYYDTAYNVHLESDDADDLYDVRDGVPLYRAQHQANVALEKLALAPGASVLDYGCGKGMSLRALLVARPDLDGAVFDVSDAYRAAWDAFVPRANQAAYAPPPSWNGRFDAVLSFFALEHVSDPRDCLAAIRALLRPGGTLHLTVPNVRRNIGDFIVVDHVNHFMPSSLHRALADAGYADIRLDEESHTAAYVVNARRGFDQAVTTPPGQLASYVAEARRFAAFWSAASDAVAAFERDRAGGRKSAIYGSGFYGVFIATRLASHDNLAYFLDRNPHQQTKQVLGHPVLAPGALEDSVEVIYVGLNPARSQAVVADVAPLHRVARRFFFL